MYLNNCDDDVPTSLSSTRALPPITLSQNVGKVEVKEARSRRMGKGKGKSRRAEIVDDCCGRWRGDDCDRRRETVVVVGSDGSNSILVFNKAYVATCNGHATHAFVKCKNMLLEKVGSNGQALQLKRSS